MSDSNHFSRREFVKVAGGAAATATLLGVSPTLAFGSQRRRYAIVGTGVRSIGMWGRDLVKQYSDVLEFVGLSDTNSKRVAVAREMMGVSCPTFTNFDEMCDKTKPDLLMVTTVDAYHAEYITKALDRGIDVVTEKPMVIDSKQCQAVLDAEKRNKRKIVVTFNYRYAPKHQKIKEVLMSGEIGRVLSVEFSWFLDVYHGADYFRRWHRLNSMGGSLWVHKATHHFDLINWWLDADPVEVSAAAELDVYGKQGPFRHSHCRPCPHKSKCRFYYDMTKNASQMRLYADCEDVDNYHRDGCVFREDVDIYDTMGAIMKYSNGTTMNYSLNAALPYEGYRLAFTGEKGRLDVRDYERQPWPVEEETEIYLTKSFGKREKIAVPHGEGGHGGGDNRLRELIFRNVTVPDYMRLPDSRAGAMSCLTGIAARTSVEQKRPVKIADLIKL
ncbi:MAG TPA: Gfo/Idh/MocA family oxidoreductase [Pyrinomonadaceae bacterium]|nr:Gfo/Idh/MocA family oxidoreductase [Pyrinomonadaceae bacterium]